MLYSLDTNVLVDAWREWYSPTSHPTFWDRIEQLARSGKLKISDTVLWVLEDVEGDTLTEWCVKREDIWTADPGYLQSRKRRSNTFASPCSFGELGI